MYFQSLEPRPRSIYDELHHSPANKKPDHQKAKPTKREPDQTVSVNFKSYVISVKTIKCAISELTSTFSTEAANYTT